MDYEGLIFLAVLLAAIVGSVFAVVKSSWLRTVIVKALTTVCVTALSVLIGGVFGVPVEASVGGGIALSAVTIVLSSVE
ncbi:hypothetical protein [Ruegeria sp. HKCCA0370]|uniref:hypothetical protein n=1 Tax=Ruegeria sp. HKCCA0370 TaxID=2682995 RepID=UPI001489606B|nr:hypothetical protein [Ruegeria sp. HKCCA0370]